jgi:hypothetical protein
MRADGYGLPMLTEQAHAKKLGGTGDVWQGRINRNYRFYFEIAQGMYHNRSPHGS